MRTYPFLHCAVCSRAHRDEETLPAGPAFACPVRASQGLWGWPCTPSLADAMPKLTKEDLDHARHS